MRSQRAALIAGVLCVFPALAFAQAWTPPAGTGNVWLSAQTLHVYAHLQGNGITAHDVDVRSNTGTLGFDYGVTNRLAFGAHLPYVSTQLRAGTPHAGAVPDDGNVHGTLTDLSVDLRYKAIDSRVVFTPAFSAIIPVRSYDTRGHAAPGKGLAEYAAGFDVGYHAVPISPSLFLGGAFRYSYVERIDPRITVDRSNADAQLDYLPTARLAFIVMGQWQRTHGGLNLPLPADQREAHGHDHDQLARANFWETTAAVTYGVTSTVDVTASWSTVLKGINSHAFRAWTMAFSWSFDGTQSRIARTIARVAALKIH